MAGGNRRQRAVLRHIVRGFAKAGDVDRGERGEVAQQVVRTDLVAAIGRERHAVRQEQDLTRAGADVAHANPRAISGPTRLAMDSGSFCHTAILAR